MKKVAMILAVLAVVLMVADMGLAEDKKPDRPKRKRPDGIRGKVVSVEGDVLTIAPFVRRKKDDPKPEKVKTVEVKTDDKTVVIIDKEKGSLGDLKKGNYVQGTVCLVLRKRFANEPGFLDEVYPLVEDEVKGQIAQHLARQNQQEQYKKIVDDLKATAEVRYNDAVLDTYASAAPAAPATMIPGALTAPKVEAEKETSAPE